MASAYFTQHAQVRVGTGDFNKTIADWDIPVGTYVIIAKFTVASNEAGPDAPQEINSVFSLHFGDGKDRSLSNLRGRDLRTVVLTVAGPALGIIRNGSVFNKAKVRLVCESTFSEIEVSSITLTAIEVDSVRAGSPA